MKFYITFTQNWAYKIKNGRKVVCLSRDTNKNESQPLNLCCHLSEWVCAHLDQVWQIIQSPCSHGYFLTYMLIGMLF